MKEQMLETWRIHNAMNLLLINTLTDSGMEKTLGNKARTVYQQLVHMHNVRISWLEVCAPDLFKKHPAIGKDKVPDRKMLERAFEESAMAMHQLFERSWDDNGKIKNFRKGLLPFLGYLISHESHHRGSILLTLKQSGEKIPDAIKWGLWEWGK